MAEPQTLRAIHAIILGKPDIKMIATAAGRMAGEVLDLREYDAGPVAAALRVASPESMGSHDILVWKDGEKKTPYDREHTLLSTVYDLLSDRNEGYDKMAALASAFGGFVCRVPADSDVTLDVEWETFQPYEESGCNAEEHLWLDVSEAIGLQAASTLLRGLDRERMETVADALASYGRYRSAKEARAPGGP